MKDRNYPPEEGRRFFQSELCGFGSVAWRTFPYFVAVLAAAIYFGCDAFSGKTSHSEGHIEGAKTMETATIIQENTAAIPPIDAAAPLETATATFALG
ncbi:MAG: hypothetical protein WAM73_11285 [Desulfobacterales bacterium]